MSQIIKKFIGANQVGASQTRLENNSYLRARNFANSADVNLLRLNSSDVFESGTDLDMASFRLFNMYLEPVQLASDPTGVTGQQYYNTTTNEMKFYDGTSWISMTGGGGGPFADTTLSNLTAATLVSQRFNPATGFTYSMGDVGIEWADIYARNLNLSAPSGQSPTLFVTNPDDGSNIAYQMANPYASLPSGNFAAGILGFDANAAVGDRAFSIFSYDNGQNNARSTGSLYFETGNKTNGTGDSGGIWFYIGSSAGGAQGEYKFFKSGVAPTVGDVWTCTNIDGTGYWAPASGGGASTSLNNLITTNINQSLVSDTDLNYDIGTNTKRWASLYAQELRNASGNKVMSITTRSLWDSSAQNLIDWNTAGIVSINAELSPRTNVSFTFGTNLLRWTNAYFQQLRDASDLVVLDADVRTLNNSGGGTALDFNTNGTVSLGASTSLLPAGDLGVNLGASTFRFVEAHSLGVYAQDLYEDTTQTIVASLSAGFFSLPANNVVRLYNAANSQSTGLRAGSPSASVTYNLPPSDGSSGYIMKTDGAAQMSWVAPPTWSKVFVTLSGTDITNQYYDLAHVALTNSVSAFVKAMPMGIEDSGEDYTLSYTGGGGGNTRINFATNWATGGGSALSAGDKLSIQFQY